MKAWKVQKFFGDLVYDLRNRGLLPVVVLLLVGMVAVPVLISRGGSEPPPPASPVSAEQATDLAPENQKAVLAYNPGLRDYRKRLNELQSKDPFKQQFANAGTAASALTSTVSGAAESATATETAPSSGATAPDSSGSSVTSGSGTAESGGSSSVKTKTKVRYFSYQTDLSIGEANLQAQSRKRVPPFTYLPDPALPVLVFLGPSVDGKSAIFLVSQSVSSMSGSGACFPAADECQLLALQTGQSQDLVYDLDGKTYRVKVDAIRRVVTSKPPKR